MVLTSDAAARETLLMRGVLDMCVLAILDIEPLHAYGLVQQLRAGGFANASYGTIYPLVTRLKNQGLVDQQLQPSLTGPARNLLTINEQGRSALKVWVQLWEETSTNAAAVLAAGDKSGKVEDHVV